MPMLAHLEKGIMMNAEQLIRFAAGPTRLIFNASGCIYRPVVHFIRENSSHGVITMPAVLSDDKDAWMGFTKAVLNAEQAVAYCMISEAWFIKATISREEADKLAETGIKSDPRREEIVGFFAEDQEGAAVQAYMKIIRTALNPKPILGELVIIPRVDGETIEGRYTGILPRKHGQRTQ
jgi:hypothetical protein